MIAALVAGTLFRTAERRTGKNGRPFTTATLKVRDGDDVTWVRVTAFSNTAQDGLGPLVEGDALSVQGPLKAELYEKDGASRVSLSIVAENVLPLRQPPRERKKAGAPQAQLSLDSRTRAERLAGSWQSPSDGPNDDIPF